MYLPIVTIAAISEYPDKIALQRRQVRINFTLHP